MAYSTSEEDSSLDSEEDSDPEIQTIFTSQPIIAPLTSPTPIAQVNILLDTYARPIPVIALFDTGAAATILHPKILPKECWLSHHQMFRVANGEIFLVTLKSKPILNRIFPTLTIKEQVLGSPLTGRDLLIGFDLLHQIPSLRWSSKGLMHKQHLLTWTQVPHLFTFDPFDSLRFQVINDCCANSHSKFLLKNPNPLWKNPNFFIHLPFKKNENVNSTKASHKGMNPEHLTLAKQELSILLSKGLIEPLTSPWACEPFYVNKHAEQVRGKLRLNILKVDLKAGFWQLGIHPEERYKTTFCILDHHYQWTVMPFGLKNAPSQFQKAMPHIAVSLSEFPDKLANAKQIQQFQGIVNYMSDFIPKISKYRSCLAQLLNKSPLEWNFVHTEAVQQLKKLAEKLPPLQIPGSGKQILQTDASDEYWVAALFEELNGKRSICGYKSGAFKPSELHYHSTFKEILAVKHRD
ncbi:uncharacterized protein LOC112015633 [Quercus suber]|uniref:uncharacterized protein LOC112015633 n=1 Tax=Quercus suber TaxID=58331 RepID=UPI000CE19822|nr:uncharacterized protein LOC112015633 [Quercus suber]